MNRLIANKLTPPPAVACDMPLQCHLSRGLAGCDFLEAQTPSPVLPDRVRTSLSKLRGIVLLGGSVGTSVFQTAIQGSILDLSVQSDLTILDVWRKQCADLCQSVPIAGLSIRMVLDRNAPTPRETVLARSDIQVSVERDPVELRGTGGLLRDLTEGYRDDDYVLVANAFQLLRTPLSVLAAELARKVASVVVVSHADGTPSGIMLVRCQCLRDLPSIGFVDMKEQGLGIISRRHVVKVLHRQLPNALPVRTRVSYLTALRQHHQDLLSQSSPDQPPNRLEDWERAFAIIESGAEVASTARIHDSVILRGARVEAGAVVINSVVCPNAVIHRGQVVTDELVQRGRRR